MDPSVALEVPETAAAYAEPRAILTALVLVVAGIVLARLAGAALSRSLRDPLGSHRTLLLERAASYSIIGLFTTSALHQLGIELSVLLGAAGILTVALGFASQTAASNFVSGVFLLGERPFEIGETIQIGGRTGVVLAIDALSIKLRTFDNLLVRIPNETVVKSEVVNYTRFPIRRYDLRLTVAPAADLDQLERVLLDAASAPVVLTDPAPLVIFQGFTESGVDVQLSAWALRDRFLEMRNRLHLDTARALEEAGIALGYPRRVIANRGDLVIDHHAAASGASEAANERG